MKYINYKNGTVLAFDEATGKATIIDPVLVEQEKIDMENRIKELEDVYNDDKKLLAWAKENYPYCTPLNQIKTMQEEKNNLLTKVSEVK